MTIQDLKRREPFMKYLGFDETKRMWVYCHQDKFHKNNFFGLIAGRLRVTVLPSLEGLHLIKE